MKPEAQSLLVLLILAKVNTVLSSPEWRCKLWLTLQQPLSQQTLSSCTSWDHWQSVAALRGSVAITICPEWREIQSFNLFSERISVLIYWISAGLRHECLLMFASRWCESILPVNRQISSETACPHAHHHATYASGFRHCVSCISYTFKWVQSCVTSVQHYTNRMEAHREQLCIDINEPVRELLYS